MPRLRLRHAFVAAMITLAMLVQGTWALAGTTGNITGILTDTTNGKPVADAKITAVSPSQSASATTDAGGHFTFLALAPDTYTMSVEKDGYTPTSLAGVTVFADQTQTLALTTQPVLKTIAKVTSRAAGSLVKSGVTGDTYNVTPGAMKAAQSLGGGGNLDNAYSAIASVPGVTVPIGGMGWNQSTYVRGSQSFFSGFEFDGVPVNRAFDNYNASTESNLGLQELQVYTGGGPASNSSAGTSGFINQVIKTGTYPGYGMLTGTISGPQFYHALKAEVGGASPNRNFSYYAGFSGYDSSPRNFDESNGASLAEPGGVFGWSSAYTTTDNFATNGRGDVPLCNVDGSTPSSVTGLPWYAGAGYAGVAGYGVGDTCFYSWPSAFTVGDVGEFTDRENVVNFHFGIPRHDGQRDDVQLLWSASAMNTIFYSSVNDMGGNNGANLNQVNIAVTGGPYIGPNAGGAAGFTYPAYIDAPGTYNLPFGTTVCTEASGCLPSETYMQPSSVQNRQAGQPLPNDLQDSFRNDTGVVKLQWTHPLSSNAYVRLFGYTFFSDWTQAGAVDTWSDYVQGFGGPTAGAEAANYDLITHTAGGEIQFADQLSPAHLLQFTTNYTTANVMRFNNSGWVTSFFEGGSPIGYIAKTSTGYECFSPLTGQVEDAGCKPNGFNSSDTNPITGSGISWESYGPNPARGCAVPGGAPYCSGYAPAGSPAALAGATWQTLWNGDASGPRNTVTPKFTFASLEDEWRPTDKLVVQSRLAFGQLRVRHGNAGERQRLLRGYHQERPLRKRRGYGVHEPVEAWSTAAGTADLHDDVPWRILAPQLHDLGYEYVHAAQPLAARRLYLHAVSGHRLAWFNRPLHRAADLCVGPVSRLCG